MSALLSALRTNIFQPGPVMVKRSGGDGLPAPSIDDAWDAPPESARRRTRLWEISSNLHCSIIGTCLSTAELRRVLIRVGIARADVMTEHECHNAALEISARPNDGAKLLHKALDRRHEVAIHQFAKLDGDDAIRRQWERALKQGEIPGAYWALLTHPATSEAVAKQAFSDVHMLSHLVGAANRADIRRLRELEEQNAALTTKIDRQQMQLRDGFTERDTIIRSLNEALCRALVQNQDAVRTQRTTDTVACIARLDRDLARETARRERLQQRLAEASRAFQDAQKQLRRVEGERQHLQDELAVLEERIGLLLDVDGAAARFDLGGLVVLYAGGRTHQLPQLRGLLEKVGGRLLYHDGGIDDNPSLLPGLVSQADLVVFPIDCISHSAVATIKRLSQQSGKRYVPLRTSSLTCLLSTLSAWSPRIMRAAAAE